MTLYLAKKVSAGEVDENSAIYLGRCDEGDCRYLADHADVQVVDDALDGHRRRAHTSRAARSEDTSRTGFMTFPYGPIASGEPSHADPPAAPAWAPSPTPREEK